MDEEKIYPICLKEIPSGSKDICQECQFDLGRLHDDSESPEQGKIGKPYLAGLLGSMIAGAFFSIVSLASDNWNPEFGVLHLVLFFFPILGFLPGGLIAGAIGDYISKKMERSEDRVKNLLLGFITFLFFASLGLIFGSLCTCSADGLIEIFR